MLGRLAAPLTLAVMLAMLWAGGVAGGQEGGDPVLVGAGDIGSCRSEGDEATADLIAGIDGTVATFGDNAYPRGTAADFARCYDPSWGQFKTRTLPSPGNHEAAGSSGYFDYFGAAAGEPGKGYYSYDLGSWHVISLNSNCSSVVGGCASGSPQEQWLGPDRWQGEVSVKKPTLRSFEAFELVLAAIRLIATRCVAHVYFMRPGQRRTCREVGAQSPRALPE